MPTLKDAVIADLDSGRSKEEVAKKFRDLGLKNEDMGFEVNVALARGKERLDAGTSFALKMFGLDSPQPAGAAAPTPEQLAGFARQQQQLEEIGQQIAKTQASVPVSQMKPVQRIIAPDPKEADPVARTLAKVAPPPLAGTPLAETTEQLFKRLQKSGSTLPLALEKARQNIANDKRQIEVLSQLSREAAKRGEDVLPYEMRINDLRQKIRLIEKAVVLPDKETDYKKIVERLPVVGQALAAAGAVVGAVESVPEAAKEGADMLKRAYSSFQLPFSMMGGIKRGRISSDPKLASQQMMKEVQKEQTQFEKTSDEIGELFGMIAGAGFGVLGLGERTPMQEGRAFGQSLLAGPVALANVYSQDPFGAGSRYAFTTALMLAPFAKGTGAGIRANIGPAATTKFGRVLQRSAYDLANVLDPGVVDAPRLSMSRSAKKKAARARRLETAEAVDTLKKMRDKGEISNADFNTMLDTIAGEEVVVQFDQPQLLSNTPAQKVGRALRGSYWGTIILGDYIGGLIGGPTGTAAAALTGALLKPTTKAAAAKVVKLAGVLGKRALAKRHYDALRLQRELVDPTTGAPLSEQVIRDPTQAGPRVKAAATAMTADLPQAGDIQTGVQRTPTAGSPIVMQGKRIRFDIGTEGLQAAEPALKAAREMEVDAVTRADAASWNKVQRDIELSNARQLQRSFGSDLEIVPGSQPGALAQRKPKINNDAISNASQTYLNKQKEYSQTFVDLMQKDMSNQTRAEGLVALRQKMNEATSQVFETYRTAGLSEVQARTLLSQYEKIARKDAAILNDKLMRQRFPSTAKQIARESGLEAAYPKIQQEFVKPGLRRLVSEIAVELKGLGLTDGQLQSFFADAFVQESQTRLLNARFRGAVTSLLADQAYKALVASKKQLSLKQSISNLAESFVSYGVKNPVETANAILSGRLSEVQTKAILKEAFDTAIRDNVNEATVKGTPYAIDFKMTDGTSTSTLQASREVWSSNKWDAKTKQEWAQGSIQDLAVNLANKAERELTKTNLAAEAKRGLELRGEDFPQANIVKAISHTFAGEVMPQIITMPENTPFGEVVNGLRADPGKLKEQVINRTAGMLGKKPPPQMVPQAANRMLGRAGAEPGPQPFPELQKRVTPAGLERNINRLGRYVKASDQIREMLVAADPQFRGKDIYVDPVYNSTVTTHLLWNESLKSADALDKLFRHSKKALTALSAKTGINNITSNMILQSVMFGRSAPRVLAGYADSLKYAHDFRKGNLSARENQIAKALFATGIVDSSILSSIYERGISKRPVGGVVGQGYRFVMDNASSIYQLGDGIPKLYASRYVFNKLHEALGVVEPGRQVVLMPSRKKAYAMTRMADGSFEVRTGNRTRRVEYNSPEMYEMVADTAVRNAKETLVDFRDVPNYLKRISKKSGLFSQVSLFLTWAHAATELPGRPGIISSAIAFEPLGYLRTNSKALGMMRARQLLKTGLKRSVLAGQAQHYAQNNAVKEMAGLGGWPTEYARYYPSRRGDTAYKAALASAVPSSSLDTQNRLLDAGSSFVAKNLGKMFGRDLLQEARETPKEQRSAFQRKLLNNERRIFAGKLDFTRDSALLLGFSQPLYNRLVKAFKENDPRAAMELILSTTAGTTAAGATMAAVEELFPDGRFMYSKIVSDDSRPEDKARYLWNRFLGIWAREVDTKREALAFIKRIKRQEYNNKAFDDIQNNIRNNATVSEKDLALYERALEEKTQWDLAKADAVAYWWNRFSAGFDHLGKKLQKQKQQTDKPLFGKKKMFPGKYPLVENPDGTFSNVKTITVEMGGKHYVLPSMAEGKQLSDDQAVNRARKIGLSKFPSFNTAEEALRFSQEKHGDQPPPK